MPDYAMFATTEALRQHLAGEKDYLLELSMTTLLENGDIDQEFVIEVWDRNNRTFTSCKTAVEVAMRCLGMQVGQIMRMTYAWQTGGGAPDYARITGFRIQPGIRTAEGFMDEGSEQFVAITGLCKRSVREAFATPYGKQPPLPVPFDMAKHIQSAFADVPVGTFLTVAQIRNHRTPDRPEGGVGAGAISARLFPAVGECNIPGIRAGMGGPHNSRGAYKVAE